MYLRIVHRERGEIRWVEAPARGVVNVGAAAEGDVQISGHNLTARHVRLHFEGRRVRVEIRSAYGVRVDGRAPRGDAFLGELEVGPWSITLEPAPPTGIEREDETFALDDADDRAVYADSLEERGRLAEATLMRTGIVDPALAAQTPPAWRRRFLPMSIEGCARADCPRAYRARCESCGRAVPVFGHIADARAHAQKGHPVAVDPAVRRWPDDLRAPVVKRPAIEMGQPTRRIS